MKTTMPPTDHEQEQEGGVPTLASPFAVDFESIRDAFDGGDPLRIAGAGAAALAPLVMGVAEASAKGGEYGIVEGKTASFLHPVIMVSTRTGHRFSFFFRVFFHLVRVQQYYSYLGNLKEHSYRCRFHVSLR